MLLVHTAIKDLDLDLELLDLDLKLVDLRLGLDLAVAGHDTSLLIRSFHSTHNVVDRGFPIQAM